MSQVIGVMGVIAILLFSVGSAGADGAAVIDRFGCQLPAVFSGLGVDLLIAQDTEHTHTVVTPSGTTMVTCHFDIPAGSEPAKAIKISGFLCQTFVGLTFDSNSVATPGGRAHLTCFIH